MADVRCAWLRTRSGWRYGCMAAVAGVMTAAWREGPELAGVIGHEHIKYKSPSASSLYDEHARTLGEDPQLAATYGCATAVLRQCHSTSKQTLRNHTLESLGTLPEGNTREGAPRFVQPLANPGTR